MKSQEKKFEKPLWLKISLDDIESVIIRLAEEGNSLEKIGLILRDQHGIPSTKVFGKKLGHILKEKGITAPGTLENAQKKFERMKGHLARHPKDKKGKRVLEIRTARVRKLQKYHKRILVKNLGN